MPPKPGTCCGFWMTAMTAEEYRAALDTLGLTSAQAATWLGVTRKTGHNYAVSGPAPAAARAVSMLLALPDRWRDRLLAAPHPSSGSV